MRITGLNNNSGREQFQGITQRIPQITINTTQDLYNQYHYLRFARYYEALDDSIYPQNKLIRNENFLFLNRIPQYLKKIFVSIYQTLTDFPDINKISKKINEEFVSNILKAQNNDVKVLMAGYDPVCSVGLNHALPGSDVDKAYVILNRCGRNYKTDDELIASYKGYLWENVDQRILSLNNENTFPEVYTLDKMFHTLDILDKLTSKIGLDKNMKYFEKKRFFDTNPVTAGEFNIIFAQNNDEAVISKVYTKNFAYFIESVRDGKIVYSVDRNIVNIINNRIRRSPFARMSNVAQIGAQERQTKLGMKDIKRKLRERESLNDEFDKWPEDTKFALVKDLVKSVSKDQSTTFNKYFQNDYDIAESYNRLNSLLV